MPEAARSSKWRSYARPRGTSLFSQGPDTQRRDALPVDAMMVMVMVMVMAGDLHIRMSGTVAPRSGR
jgi:hypothetical protein